MDYPTGEYAPNDPRNVLNKCKITRPKQLTSYDLAVMTVYKNKMEHMVGFYLWAVGERQQGDENNDWKGLKEVDIVREISKRWDEVEPQERQSYIDLAKAIVKT